MKKAVAVAKASSKLLKEVEVERSSKVMFKAARSQEGCFTNWLRSK